MLKKILPLFLFSCMLRAETWQFEAAAVNDLGRMTREALFAQWLPISLPEGQSPAIPGEFVMYQHEGLTYFFGPYLNDAEAAQAEKTLQNLRNRLIQMDAKFQSSSVERVQSNPGGGSNDGMPSTAPKPAESTEAENNPPASPENGSESEGSPAEENPAGPQPPSPRAQTPETTTPSSENPPRLQKTPPRKCPKQAKTRQPKPQPVKKSLKVLRAIPKLRKKPQQKPARNSPGRRREQNPLAKPTRQAAKKIRKVPSRTPNPQVKPKPVRNRQKPLKTLRNPNLSPRQQAKHNPQKNPLKARHLKPQPKRVQKAENLPPSLHPNHRHARSDRYALPPTPVPQPPRNLHPPQPPHLRRRPARKIWNNRPQPRPLRLNLRRPTTVPRSLFGSAACY